MLNSGLVLNHVFRARAELRASIESRVNVDLVHGSFQILFIFTMGNYFKRVKSGITYQHVACICRYIMSS